ncbi:MAG: radical SAM protein [Myxococcota bacterium]
MRTAILTRGDLFPTHHGAAVKIVRTAEALAARGDPVVVITDDRDAYWRVARDGWVRVPYGRRFRAFEEWPWLRDGARAERWCDRVGYPRDEWFLYRPVFDPAWWARALYVGLRERVDVFQAEFPGYAAPATLAARVLGGRSVAVMHNVEFDRLAQMAGLRRGALARVKAIEVALLRATDAVIAVSEVDRQRIVSAGVATGRVRVVPHGVDLASYRGEPADLRARYGLPDGPVLFFHGTLHYAPNADAVRFIAEAIAPRLTAGAVVVAGLTPPRELETERLRFAGPVDDLAAHVEGADLCLCPLFAGGGTRMKLLEYFAAGKAVVSTAIGAEGLEVRDGREIVIAEREGFADAVLSLLADAPRRARLGAAARAYARARDWSAVAATYGAIHRGEPADFQPRPPIEAHLPPRTPSKPLTMLFLVNRGCNLRCRFCDLWEGKAHVPVERALALFDEAARIGTRAVVLTGGEPGLHPGLATLVRGAKARGLGVNVTTNGTMADRVYDDLHAAGVDSLSFSIDGAADTHDRLRGQAGAHARTWKQLLRWRHLGRAANVYYTVTRENVGELVPTWEEARRAGAGFDFWPVNDAPDLTLKTKAQKAAWRDAVAHIARTDPEIRARAHYYGEALRYHAGERVPMRCLGLVDQYGVKYDGTLIPCCVWGGDGLAVGNVFETPLSALWESDAVQAHRERLFSHGCDAGCYNHSLYEFTVSTGLSHRVDR